MICANWDDLDPAPDGTGYIYWYHDVANHRLVVEWDSVAYWNQTSARDKFEVVFYDTTVTTPSGDNEIVVQYKTTNGFTSSTLGIEDPTQAIGIQDLYNGTYNVAAAQIQPGRAIKYATTTSSGIEQGITRAALHLGLSVLPNPLSGNGFVRFSLPEPGPVSLKLYSADGRLVRTLLSSPAMTPGTYSVPIANRHSSLVIPRGVYFLKLETDSGTVASKLVMLD
jgi:hypothetical protein